MNQENKSATRQWRKLDNAAKVFPATASKKNTKVFRFYCELNEEVIQENLQEAVELTLEKFPVFKTVMRRGFFWYYLENKEYIPTIKVERKSPCSGLYSPDKIKLLFRVNYYKNRINFEVFHVLTDGTGATEFLRELIKNYLYITHKDKGLEKIEVVEDIAIAEQENDSFTKYYSKDIGKPDKKVKASYQIKGVPTKYNTLQVYEGVLNTKEVLPKAKEYGVSLTVYLTAVLLCAINKEIPNHYKKRRIALMVPVNLRNFFPSKSMMNFFGYIAPSYSFKQREDMEFKEVLEKTKSYFADELTVDKMSKRMNEYTRLEKHPILKFVPLDIKNFAIMMGALTATRDITAIFSNMSVVKMPESYEPYIKQFGVLTSTPKLELCMCSFKDRMVLNFTSYYDSSQVKDNFFQILRADGVRVEEVREQFPAIPEEQKREVRFRQRLDFTCITLAIISIMINVIYIQRMGIAMITLGAVLSMWVSVSQGYKQRNNLLKTAMIQLLIINVGAVIWDLMWGYMGWSISLVWPVVSIVMIIFMSIMARVQKLSTTDYMTYMGSNILVGVIPGIWLAMGAIEQPLFAVLSTGIHLLVLSYLIIFKRYEFLIELNKNLHV